MISDALKNDLKDAWTKSSAIDIDEENELGTHRISLFTFFILRDQ